MPQISYFYGILITMYWNEGYHATPHVLVEYAGDKASVDFEGTVLGGSIPPRCLRLVREWAALYEDELKANWERARRLEPLELIPPLS